MTFGDTNSSISNFSEVIDTINQTAVALESSYMVMGNLVTRHDIPSGQDRVRIPYQTDTFVANAHTDGDEIVGVQQMNVDTIDLTTNMLEITYRISRRALRQPAVDLAMLCGDEQAQAAAEALEVRLISTFDDTGTQDLGFSGADTTLSAFRTSRRLLRNISRANGGPTKAPVFAVINAVMEEDLLTDLGVTAGQLGSTNVAPRVLNIVNDLIEGNVTMEDAYCGTFVRIPTFVSSYVGSVVVGDITTPAMGGVFWKGEIHLGVAEEWEVEPFRSIEWPGIAVRAMTDYGVRLGPFPKHVIQFDTDID